MTASDISLIKIQHPSHPLPNVPLLNPPDDPDTILFKTESTIVTTDFYDRSPISRRFAIIGLALSSIISFCCIIIGVVILAIHGAPGVIPLMKLSDNATRLELQFEMLSLILNALVTLCTESTGFVHSISLRSALASEGRLHFNTNLRLLTAARGWRNPNGVLCNGIMAILLILSYSSSSLVISYNYSSSRNLASAAIAGFPLFFLGAALLLQVVIALLGMWGAEILTWSSSPFNMTAALVHNQKLTRFNSRCMCCVSDQGVDPCPMNPSNTQPSAWHAHFSIRMVVICLWAVVVSYATWAGMVTYSLIHYPSPYVWSFLPQEMALTYGYSAVNIRGWIVLFLNIAAIQGPLTIGLHCSELITNVIRDEGQWRCATEKKGLKTTTNPLMSVLTHLICLILFAMKPFLHWMYGLSANVAGGAEDGKISGGLAVVMYAAQIWNLCVALFIFACFFTFIALRRPHGPQPAAYGHLQTLANLIDSPLSPVMWWGHKKDGLVCHAGTSDHELRVIEMDCVYAGPGAESLASVSST